MEKAIVTAFAIRDSLLFAGIPRYGIYRSTDDGENWVRTSNGMPTDLHISSLVFVGANIVVGTDMNGIFRSIDSGTTWMAAYHGPPVDIDVQSFTSSPLPLDSTQFSLSIDQGKSEIA